MGCPSEVVIGDNLVFSVCTHDPTTGVLTDADDVPAYRVYEDETATPILTGSMAKLDDVNTTGFYTESIACTAANGFEDGKSYALYITAAVGGDTGGVSYVFKAVTGDATTIDGKVDDLLEALVYKQIITNATGDAEIFDSANASRGTVATAFTEDGTYTTRLKLVI
jgi:hypothetical protein